MAPVPRTRYRHRFNRKWTVEQKLRILKEVEAAREHGERGGVQAICEKYFITTAFITLWTRELRGKGLLK